MVSAAVINKVDLAFTAQDTLLVQFCEESEETAGGDRQDGFFVKARYDYGGGNHSDSLRGSGPISDDRGLGDNQIETDKDQADTDDCTRDQLLADHENAGDIYEHKRQRRKRVDFGEPLG